jgi:tetratricopeptide (TPR) repeat protein
MHLGDATAAPAPAEESRVWLALPLLASIAAYAIVATGGFVWDDFFLIVNSPLVTGQGSWVEHFSQPFSNNPLQEARSFFRPLITLSYWLDFRVWGGWPGGFHLTNLALHMAFVLLLFALCQRAGAGRPVAASLSTLFAVSPRLSESVAWISGRTDIAAGILALGAMLLFKAGPGGWFRRLISGVLLFLALLCKEVAVAAAVALALSAWLQAPRTRPAVRWCLDMLPVAIAVMAYGVLRTAILRRSQDTPLVPVRGMGTALVLTFEAMARYGWMILDPFQPRLQIGDANHPSLLLAAVGASGVAGAVLLLWKYRCKVAPQAWAAMALASTSLALVLPAMPLDLNVIAADRFLYLPLAGLALSLASPLEHLWKMRRIPFLIVAAVLIAAFAVPTSVRARRWASEIQLWREAVAQSSTEQPLPRIELSAALMRRGRYDEALGFLKEVAPSKHLAIAVNVATCLDKLGNRDAAIRMVTWVVGVQPRRVNAWVNLMLLHARAGRFDLAGKMGQRLLRDFPYRSDIPPLVTQVDRTMVEMKELPVEVPDEPAALKARRATLYDRLGALPEAQSLWKAIASDPAAEPEMRLRAASYIALFGYPEVARQVLAELASDPFARSQLAALQVAFQSRFEDG